MDLEKVFSLIDKAEKSSFNKIEIQMQDVKICLERTGITNSTQHSVAVLKENKTNTQGQNDQADFILAPISGVFYAANEPGEEPFVKEGSRVEQGDTVCIIEAMKTMNQISAPKAGVIEYIYLKDGETATVKDTLFRYAKVK